ncbi:hypothetical protein DFJ73DRAFT_868161 [Zopfochytrium polystomum]|nr:hypothetical protein DFJ73DRAFT_868161 [Zopfochytrium polystomum]
METARPFQRLKEEVRDGWYPTAHRMRLAITEASKPLELQNRVAFARGAVEDGLIERGIDEPMAVVEGLRAMQLLLSYSEVEGRSEERIAAKALHVVEVVVRTAALRAAVPDYVARMSKAYTSAFKSIHDFAAGKLQYGFEPVRKCQDMQAFIEPSTEWPDLQPFVEETRAAVAKELEIEKRTKKTRK